MRHQGLSVGPAAQEPHQSSQNNRTMWRQKPNEGPETQEPHQTCQYNQTMQGGHSKAGPTKHGERLQNTICNNNTKHHPEKQRRYINARPPWRERGSARQRMPNANARQPDARHTIPRPRRTSLAPSRKIRARADRGISYH